MSEAHLAAATGFALGVSSLRSDARAASFFTSPRGEVGARSAPGEGIRPIESHLPPHPNPLPSRSRIYPTSANLKGRTRASPSSGGRGSPAAFAALSGATSSGSPRTWRLPKAARPTVPASRPSAFSPEHLLTVAAARPRDLLWAMEEALRCRAVHAVIGELRHGEIDRVAIRRLSLAAAESGALALLLRARPAATPPPPPPAGSSGRRPRQPRRSGPSAFRHPARAQPPRPARLVDYRME